MRTPTFQFSSPPPHLYCTLLFSGCYVLQITEMRLGLGIGIIMIRLIGLTPSLCTSPWPYVTWKKLLYQLVTSCFYNIMRNTLLQCEPHRRPEYFTHCFTGLTRQHRSPVLLLHPLLCKTINPYNNSVHSQRENPSICSNIPPYLNTRLW